MSQKDDVKKLLTSGQSITPIEALTKFGAFRLSAIIFDLRQGGLNIITNMIVGGNNRYAEYKLISEISNEK